jgi:hypothetical protein
VTGRGQHWSFKDRIGQVHYDLTVVEYAGRDKSGKHQWRCLCKCGKSCVVLGSSLTGNTKSCGCRVKTHGMTLSPEYQAWRTAKRRCIEPSCASFKDYGGRGITMCDRWLNSFENFYADLGPRPLGPRRYSLERIDNDGPYEPSNCKWATLEEQNSNRRSSRLLEVGCFVGTLTQWCAIYDLKDYVVRRKLANGLSPQMALGIAP